jgi:hypothetical protein
LVAFDTSKTKYAVAIAASGRRGEVRFVGDVASSLRSDPFPATAVHEAR